MGNSCMAKHILSGSILPIGMCSMDCFDEHVRNEIFEDQFLETGF